MHSGPMQRWNKSKKVENRVMPRHGFRMPRHAQFPYKIPRATCHGMLPLTKPMFLTYAAACQIMPRHDLKNLKIKNPRTFSLFYTSKTYSPKLKTLIFPIFNPLNLNQFPSKPIKIPSNLISKTPISQYNS